MRDVLRLGIVGLLYGVMATGANPVAAGDLTDETVAALKESRTGDMRKLVIHREARPMVEEIFRDRHGNARTLADYNGKLVVMNFWATWCPPCRAEMPSIDRLAATMADEAPDDVAVIALSTDRGDINRVVDFFDEINVGTLEVLHDRSSGVARRAGVLGLPVTIILDRQGREIARLQGEAEWDSPDVRAIVDQMASLTAPGS